MACPGVVQYFCQNLLPTLLISGVFLPFVRECNDGSIRFMATRRRIRCGRVPVDESRAGRLRA